MLSKQIVTTLALLSAISIAPRVQAQSVYRLDDGLAEIPIGVQGGAASKAMAWLNRFVAQPNMLTITSVRVAFGTIANGTPVTVYIWADPNQDGIPSDAVVLASGSGLTANGGTNAFNDYALTMPVTLTAGDIFFAGAIINNFSTGTIGRLDTDGTDEPPGYPPNNHSFIAATTAAAGATVNPNNLAGAQLPVAAVSTAIGQDGSWLVRAVPVPPTGACCSSGICSIETLATCSAISGTYQGDGTSCTPDPCGCPPAFEWDQVQTSFGGAARLVPAMVYDSARQLTVMFGGHSGITPVSPITWEWNGVNWSQAAATGPAARSFQAMAYDSARGVTVLFGGNDFNGPVFSDTWEYDGQAWTQIPAAGGPGALDSHAMTYDSARGRVVLFGGYSWVFPGGGSQDKTWEYDGATWAQIPIAGPPSRQSHALAYDSARGVTVLFGGLQSASSLALGDTWEYDGATWTQVVTPGPSPRFYSAMAYDSGRGVMVLYGGQSNAPSTFYDDTWEFDGSTWTQVTTPGLGNRSYHAMAFDGSSNQTVLFGGATDNFPLPVDTWAYPEPNVHSTFCVMGSGNGSDWAWSVNSATWDVTELSTGGVVGSPEVVADFFAGQINAAGCSGLAAAALPGTSCFNVTAGGSQPFSLCVGPALAPPACCVAAGSVCPFNPDLVLLSDTDCNKNGEDDAIDIYLGLLPDANGDGIPDNCTGCAPASCADEDGDGIRDDNCVHAACVDGACVHTAITFAEMGGAFGDCAPDGAADANDRFHALNCFSDTATDGSAGYPCEAQPPHAYNVDAGGSFGDCDPDGVCDGHDAFHALNAFSGATVCSCSPGPSPGYKIAPRTVDATGLAVVAPPGAAAPGVTFEVDVYIDGPLNDLRGYQLHLGVAGGRRGRLDLIDITIHPRQDHVFAGAEHWSAFNTATGQMVAGRDGPGVATAGRAYLATFIYQASADAAGVFTIDMLHSEADPAQRTFMFPTQSDGRIAIDRAVPAEILVRGRKR